MRSSFALAALLATTLGGTCSFAAAPQPGTTTTAPGTPFHAASPAALRDSGGLQEIYSTFGTDASALYDCCFAYNLTTLYSGTGFKETMAMAFTPARTAEVRRIELGLSWFQGPNLVDVALAEDAGGVPGNTLKVFKVTDIPAGGNCCDFMSVSPRGITLEAGRTYWVVAKAKGAAYAGWNLNNILAYGPIAYDVGQHLGWQAEIAGQAAFRVLGR